jgi:hypothetical protein
MIARAHVTTEKPVAYMRQLCKHFGHKLTASFDDRTGQIAFDYGDCQLVAGEDQLTIVVTAEDEPGLERLRDVVGRHLERFGRRDGLAVEWQLPTG